MEKKLTLCLRTVVDDSTRNLTKLIGQEFYKFKVLRQGGGVFEGVGGGVHK